MTDGELIGEVGALWRYPVKSLLGEELGAAEVTANGLAGDRAYALFDPADGRVASAKSPRRWGRLFEFSASYVEEPDGDGKARVRIVLPDGTAVESDQPDVDARLSAVFGREVRLLSEPPPGAKYESIPVNRDPYEPDAGLTDYPLNRFFDLGVLHLLATSTLDHMSALYPQGRFEARRFRPNIVVRTEAGAGFVENGWVGKTLAIGEAVRIRAISPTIRCVMTTLPQGDLPRDPLILRTAAQHNQSNVGVYAMVVEGGTVRRGDEIRMLE